MKGWKISEASQISQIENDADNDNDADNEKVDRKFQLLGGRRQLGCLQA